MTLELNKQEENILKALVSSIYESNVGVTDNLAGYYSTDDMSDEEIRDAFETLSDKVRKVQ